MQLKSSNKFKRIASIKEASLRGVYSISSTRAEKSVLVKAFQERQTVCLEISFQDAMHLVARYYLTECVW